MRRMPRRTALPRSSASVWHSIGFALEGLRHVLRCERNVRIFLPCFVLLLLLCAWLRLLHWEWVLLLLSGGSFLAVELLNTALERLTDAVDELHREKGTSFHQGLKATKDIAAAGSLISLLAFLLTTAIVLWPYVVMIGKPLLH